MPCRPEKVPKRLSATATAHRSAAQYGQYSAPMYSTSGLPPAAAGGPGTEMTEPEYVVQDPTAFRVACGTVAMSVRTLGGRAVPVEEAAEAEPGLAGPGRAGRILGCLDEDERDHDDDNGEDTAAHDQDLVVDLHRCQAGQRRDFTRWSTAGLTP